MAIPPLQKGYKRQWTKCKKCGHVAFYDFVPFSLSNPIRTLPCNHGLGVPFHDAVVSLSADEAIVLLQEQRDAVSG